MLRTSLIIVTLIAVLVLARVLAQLDLPVPLPNVAPFTFSALLVPIIVFILGSVLTRPRSFLFSGATSLAVFFSFVSVRLIALLRDYPKPPPGGSEWYEALLESLAPHLVTPSVVALWAMLLLSIFLIITFTCILFGSDTLSDRAKWIFVHCYATFAGIVTVLFGTLAFGTNG